MMHWLQGESMESTECVNNGIKCWCVDAKKETRVKKGQERGEKHEKEGKEDKQGREEGFASQHAAISAFISAEHPDTQGRSPWHTAFTKAVCVFCPFHHNNKSQMKTQCKHTHSGFLGLGCEKE